MDQSETTEMKAEPAIPVDQEESADDYDDIPPLESVKEAIKEEKTAKPHNKNIKGIKTEGDSDGEETVEEGKDGWTDILSNGELRKKTLVEGNF